MGNVQGFFRQEEPLTTKWNLQKAILFYIYQDMDDNRNPAETFKVRRFGYVDIEHFVRDIPPDVIKKFQNCEHTIRILKPGVRMVVKENRSKGTFTNIRVTVHENNDGAVWNEILVELKMDSTRGKMGMLDNMRQDLKMFEINELLPEKCYLKRVLDLHCQEEKNSSLSSIEIPNTVGNNGLLLQHQNVQESNPSLDSHGQTYVDMIETTICGQEQHDGDPEIKVVPSRSKETANRHKAIDAVGKNEIRNGPTVDSSSNVENAFNTPNSTLTSTIQLPKLYSVSNSYEPGTKTEEITMEVEGDSVADYEGKHELKRNSGDKEAAKCHKKLRTQQPQSTIHTNENDIPHKSYKKALMEGNDTDDKLESTVMLSTMKYTGERRGIQGRNNSCYMDTLLFTWFYCTNAFDTILLSKPNDFPEAKKLRILLQESIVQPLRKYLYCPYENLKEFRQHLSKFDDRISGSMMDIEELIYLILQQILEEQEFLEFVKGSKEFMHQLIINPENLNDSSISLQKCLETSFDLWGQLQLNRVPWPGLMLQLPRSDGELVKYKAIVPNLVLDISPVVSKRRCQQCHKRAKWECIKCPGSLTSLCNPCSQFQKLSDVHKEKYGHGLKLVDTCEMDLYAVICIRNSHYTAFVKEEFEWLYFDSMAGQFPEVRNVPELETELRELEQAEGSELEMSSLVRRVVEDGHVAIYLPRIK